MNFLPAGAEESSDDDGFSFSYEPRRNVQSHNTTNSTKKTTSYGIPAGAESSDDDFDCFGSFADRNVSKNTTSYKNNGGGSEVVTSGNTVEKPQSMGRGRGMLDNRGRGGFGTPTPPPQSGRGRKRNQRKSASHKPSGPSPVQLEDFKVAVVKGNIAVVQKSIDEGIPVDVVLSSGWTALMHAANSGNTELVKNLLSQGANANFHKDMYTVLMAVCDAAPSVEEEKAFQCCELLLENGARTGVYDRHRITPLMYAARQGRVSLCKKLIEKGAQVDKQDVRGWTALSWAASEGHGRLVRVLLDYKADPQLYSSDGQAPCDIAYSKGHDTIAEILEAASSGGLRLARVNRVEGDNESVCDELHLFLSGLELGHLVPKFKEHKVVFTDLLKMTEHDLKQMGISQVGVRKKLLDAICDVHSKEWTTTSLQQHKKLISAPEVTNVLANISKHLSVIHASVGYAQKQIQAISDPTMFIKDVSEAEGLVLYAREASSTAASLQHDMAALQTRVNELSIQTALISADLINPKYSTEGSQKSRSIMAPLLLLGIAGAAIAGFCYKKYAT
ncbi:predicted protein [Nematostella vectensis]|uniref:Ankyrin repeat, SAM and basic leucine zipper domain-containing protein 1 n=1 Tax=Nematostella vectensis TaxID=45351 RepID=A7RNE2_NEMVE|nr:ankyrin repeat, SAM and basic leucine zipper domain-containing protein 1 [Nematostella vectensis]XP_032219943.1 ankyrin repeat, SAM and basic leucine zipper domain-containing protein 1 [Nematostella vectensis]EDO47126.1 predicted protein [Nematostella vectensis]|eukprot:XP_001639189.1 predicted protein [Nematostella vectensis]